MVRAPRRPSWCRFAGYHDDDRNLLSKRSGERTERHADGHRRPVSPGAGTPTGSVEFFNGSTSSAPAL